MEATTFSHAAVAAPHMLASQAGQNVLVQGGNAVEAMIAMAATAGVVCPHIGGLGGDAVWLVRDRNRRVHCIEAFGPAGEKASLAAYRALGHHEPPTSGALAAATVPGTIGGWLIAQDMAAAFGGRLPLDILLEDARRHARGGIAIPLSQRWGEPALYEILKSVPGFADLFMKEGKPLDPAGTFIQPALADMLEQLAHAGLDDFYRGDVGREIASDLERAGSFVTRQDLGRYRARLRAPLSLPGKGVTLVAPGAPANGLLSLLAMGLLERLHRARSGGFEHIHGLIEAAGKAAAIASDNTADPAVLEADPASFLAPGFLDAQAALIAMDRAQAAPAFVEGGAGVWMGAIDREGVAVSYFQSLHGEFGSGLVLPETGLVLHNAGSMFSLDARSVHALGPGRIPFHPASPMLALFDDGAIMSFGAGAGGAQPQILAQILSRFLHGSSLAEAVAAPRALCGAAAKGSQPVLFMEDRFEDALYPALERAGHSVEIAGGNRFGHAGALLRHAREGRIEAVHDPRSGGGPSGL